MARLLAPWLPIPLPLCERDRGRKKGSEREGKRGGERRREREGGREGEREREKCIIIHVHKHG